MTGPLQNSTDSNVDFNESTDLANLCLRLRGGLRFELQENGKKPCYVVHDETSSSYYEIGIPEYAFISVLDGNTTLQQAIEETSNRMGGEALTIRDAIRICHWLMQSGLASSADGSSSNVEHLLEQVESQSNQKVVGQLNPLFIKLPLGNPQPLIKAVSPFLGWLGSQAFFTIWCGVFLLAIYRLFLKSSELSVAAQAMFTPGAWAWMLGTMVLLKVAHELGHGLFCHRYGGRVKETGFVFILFIPIPYVDVTSCWGFSSKWKRIAVGTAGMYVEIFLAALAAVGWSFVQDPVLRFHLFNVMLIGSLSTVLFNANFLMRFDGYYILADLLEIPNLYQKGQQFVNGLGRRFLLGMNASPLNEPRRKRVLIQAYGLGAWIWRIVICISLSILAMALFYGFGIALAIGGIVLWLGTPIWRFVSQWRDPASNDSPNWKWISMVTTPVMTAIVAAMILLPWPVQVSAPAIVKYDSPEVIRADAGGFVKRIHAIAGQRVQAGERLIDLENKEMTLRFRQLELDREMSLIRSRGYHQNREIAAYQSENASRAAIEDQIRELQQKLDSLTLRATSDGIVTGENLETLPGQFVVSGTSLMKVVDESKKKVVAAVSQDDFETFNQSESEPTVFAPTFGTMRLAGVLYRVEPTASSKVDARLTSHAGGSLPVRQVSSESAGDSSEVNDAFQLLASRFTGEVRLNAEDSMALPVGTTGSIRLSQFNETIGEHLVVRTRRWIAGLMTTAGF